MTIQKLAKSAWHGLVGSPLQPTASCSLGISFSFSPGEFVFVTHFAFNVPIYVFL